MNNRYANENEALFDEEIEEINEELSRNTVAYMIVCKDIEEQERQNRIAYDNNEGLEQITDIAERYTIRSLSDDRACFEECFGFELVDTFRDISENPYVFKSSEDLSRNDARPGVTVCEMTDERLWYDIKKKSRFVPCDDGVGRKREEYYEKTPRSKSALKRKIVYNTLFPDVQKKYVKDRRFPIYPLISIVLCMAILIIPIYLSVLNNEINVENKEYDAYIRELREEIDVLNEELCKKNDMVLIDRIAREEYGMIDVELSNTHLMAPSSDEIVINELDSEEETNLWVSLLNALGVFFEK
jgi:hypothetical protein